MNEFEFVLIMIGAGLSFGAFFLFMIGAYKLIKYRIDKKSESWAGGKEIKAELESLREFRKRAEKRLRVLEQIAADEDLSGDAVFNDLNDEIIPEKKTDENVSEKSRLENRLKS